MQDNYCYPTTPSLLSWTRRRAPRVALGIACVIVLLADAGFVYLHAQDSATAVSVSRALERFRATIPDGTIPTPGTTGLREPTDARHGDVPGQASSDQERPDPIGAGSSSRASGTPETAGPDLSLAVAGVYVYATEGHERVDVLGGTTHTYPAETTITVTAAGCGIVSRWDALAERWDERRTCLEEAGEVMHSLSAYHEFFGQPDRRDYTCEGVVVHPPRSVLGRTWDARCSSPTTTIRITSTFVDVQTLDIGGTAVEALHGHGTSTVDGSVRGTQSEEMWLDARTGLPLRRISTVDTEADSPLGTAHYHEEYEIRLASLAPRA